MTTTDKPTTALDDVTIEHCAKVVDGKQQQILRQSYQDTASRLAAEMLGNAAYTIRSLPSSPAPDGWPSMESAPKAGSFLAWWHASVVGVVAWSEKRGRYDVLFCTNKEVARQQLQPSGWMHFPAPPDAKEK